jgi:propanediol dehydratase small subunit
MAQFTLTEKQVEVVIHALQVAAERFVVDAAVCREADQPRLAEQFEIQARDSRELAERFE